jgi:16S rRNA (adenine1518-N6/adenine1519-N6)-dimethyltransferase
MRRTKRQTLGQHFLHDPGILKKIIQHIDPQPEDTIIEIGAGRGALTFPLLTRAGRVFAIEKDRSLVQCLQESAHQNLVVLEEDVLRVSFQRLVGRSLRPKLVGNLPYSISSPILFAVAGEKILFAGCWFLLQKEVAERVCSPSGTKKYAPISVLIQNVFIPKIRFSVSPSSFSPPPKVESSFLSLTPREKPLFSIQDKDRFLGFLRMSFQHRRKILLNNLMALGVPRKRLTEILNAAGVEENSRAEQVAPSQFFYLYERLFRD